MDYLKICEVIFRYRFDFINNTPIIDRWLNELKDTSLYKYVQSLVIGNKDIDKMSKYGKIVL